MDYILCNGDKCKKCTDESVLSIVDSSSLFTVKSIACTDDILQDCLVITLYQKQRLPTQMIHFFHQNPFLSKKSYDLGNNTQYKRLAYILCAVDTREICKDICEQKDDNYWIKVKGYDEQGYMNEGGP